VDRAERAVLVRGAHGELVAVRLAEQDRAGGLEPLLRGGGVRRPIALEDEAARRGRQAAGQLVAVVVESTGDEDVLQGVRDAEQRPVAPLATGARLVGVPGATRFVAADNAPIVVARGADYILLSGIIFDGSGKALPENSGLIQLANGRGIAIRDCEVLGAGRNGIVLEGIEGEIATTTITGAKSLRGSYGVF